MLIIGFPAPPENYDPWHTSHTHHYLLYGIYETLTLMGPDGRFYPSLATSVTSPDPLTFIVTLRKGVKFHDGSPVTVQDVKASFDRGIQKPLFRSYAVVSLKSVEILDDSTLKFNLKGPDVDFFFDLGASPTAIMPKVMLDKYGDEVKNQLPVGTGPFKFVEYIPGDRWVQDRNDAYWGGPANVKRVIVRFIKEEAVRALEVQRGGIHGYGVQDNRFISDLRKAGVQLFALPPGFRITLLVYDLMKPYFQDINVRRAINYVLDRQAFIDVLEAGESVKGQGIVPPYMKDYYDPNFKVYDYDVAKAKEFMANSKYPNGFSTKFLVTSDLDNTVAPIIISNLGAIGIKVEVDRVDAAKALERRFNFGYEMTLFTAAGSHPSPGGVFALFFHTKNIKPFGQNIAHTNATEVAKLLDQQIDAFMSEIDPAKRRPSIREFEKTLIENAIVAPLYYKLLYIAASHQLKGMQIIPTQATGPNGIGNYIHAPHVGLSVWLDPDEPILKPQK